VSELVTNSRIEASLIAMLDEWNDPNNINPRTRRRYKQPWSTKLWFMFMRPALQSFVDSLTETHDLVPRGGDSGRVVVDRARFERLLAVSAEYTGMSDSWKLEPGDLEPL